MKNPVISPPVASGINRLPTPPGEEHLLTFGGSRLWILRRESGWGLALEPPELLGAGQLSGDVLGGSFSYTAAPKPAELPWASYYVEDEEDSLLVELVLPNRPVAAHPQEPILLPDGESACFTTPIPLYLRLVSTARGRELMTIPSIILSKSLFGAPDTGEIVYSSPLEVRPRGIDFSIPDYCARCDLKVQNISGSLLDFSRVCIRVEFLALHLREHTFITDELVFAFRGGEHASSLSFGRRTEAEGYERIAPARITSYSNLIRKSFDFFRSLASY